MSVSSIIILDKANEFFYKKTKKNLLKFTINIPIIKKMFNIDVSSNFHIEKITRNNCCGNGNGNESDKLDKKINWKYSFDISSKKIKNISKEYYKFLFYEKTFDNLNVKNINQFLKKIQEILSQINFNKLTGLFESTILKMSQTKSKSNLTTNLNENKEISEISECCICYDETLNQTLCSHFLCVDCWTRLKKSECPYCRSKKLFIKQIE